MDKLASYNRKAWNREVERENRWTVPVSPAVIQRAREGDWEVVLTPQRPVPRAWFPKPMAGADALCLASGGGQQGPILAAAGAAVTVLDNSDAQLARDEEVATREDLSLTLLQGDMRDLSPLDDQSFDLVFHPCSNSFVPDVLPVWREAFRVLRPGGSLLSGFSNPMRYLFDWKKEQKGELEVRHTIPYADETNLEKDELRELVDELEPLEFGHSLEDQIGGQLAAGFAMTGFYEDRYKDHKEDPLSRYIDSFIATCARKP